MGSFSFSDVFRTIGTLAELEAGNHLLSDSLFDPLHLLGRQGW